MEMILSLHPNINRDDLMRSDSMLSEKKEIKDLTQLMKKI